MPETPDAFPFDIQDPLTRRLIQAAKQYEGSVLLASEVGIAENDLVAAARAYLDRADARAAPRAETPDFEQNADKLLAAESLSMFHPENREFLKMYLVSLQREAWNARGAADLTILTVPITSASDFIRPTAARLDDAIAQVRALNR